MSINDILRQLPSVSDLLEPAQDLIEREGRGRTVQALRDALDAARAAIKAGAPAPSTGDLIAAAQSRIQTPARTTINATGVILHTNLGRATLSVAAQAAMLAVARDYSPLEFDLATGARGRRGAALETLLCELTGAEAALVVNNCAAATVLMLAAVAAGTGVVISRGQLVEIGGGFRVPDIMAQSGARLIEVGTTNRVRRADYEHALEGRRGQKAEGEASDSGTEVGAVLRVHASNFKMIGFTEDVGIAELVDITQARFRTRGSTASVPVLDDLGSGALIDTARFGLAREPMPQDSVRAGAAVVCFSGDKLVGGPQAGIMVGQEKWIERCRRHPLARAVRADKYTLAALEATLLHYARGEAEREVPVMRMIAMPKAEIARRAEAVRSVIGDWLATRGLRAELIDGESTVGGGSLPGETLPTTVIALVPSAGTRHGAPGVSGAALQAALRAQGVVARVNDGRVLLDLRTVFDDAALVEAILRASPQG
jgi:L-seryl-tRNA(Ser) seleniumtransferase